MTKKYMLKVPHAGFQTGTMVYSLAMSDYGCANSDSRLTGVEHTSVTLDKDGGYPSFTVPLGYLMEVPNEPETEAV